jgi:hypothetical protein
MPSAIQTHPSQTNQTECGWAGLKRELDAWRCANITARFWWRDDDLENPGPRLDRLLTVASSTPICLAIIPKSAATTLMARLSSCRSVDVIQHGYEHRNHAAAESRKCELGDDRPPHEVLADIVTGRNILSSLFGKKYFPVMAPPWNRISNHIGEQLQKIGFQAISGFGEQPARSVPMINTHIDPVDWKGTRGFIGSNPALRVTVQALRKRRLNAGLRQPIGLLTHHRILDEAGWQFIERFVKLINTHPGANLVGIRDLIPPHSIEKNDRE